MEQSIKDEAEIQARSQERVAFDACLSETRHQLDNGTPFYNPFEFFETLAANWDSQRQRAAWDQAIDAQDYAEKAAP